eukprot:351963-Chlamydomonas_euryale.AAC.7
MASYGRPAATTPKLASNSGTVLPRSGKQSGHRLTPCTASQGRYLFTCIRPATDTWLYACAAHNQAAATAVPSSGAVIPGAKMPPFQIQEQSSQAQRCHRLPHSWPQSVISTFFEVLPEPEPSASMALTTFIPSLTSPNTTVHTRTVSASCKHHHADRLR